MSELLPSSQHQLLPPNERKLRRRLRLSLAVATLLSSLVGAVTTIIVTRPRENELRKDLASLKQSLSEQSRAIERLIVETNASMTEVRAIRAATLASHPVKTSSASEPDPRADTPGGVPGKQGKAPPAVDATREKARYRFVLQGCQKSGGSVTCDLLITNNDDAEREVGLYHQEGLTRAFANGGEYEVESCRVGLGPKARDRIKLPGHITIPASVYFAGIPEGAQRISALQIDFWSAPGGQYRLEWRDVALGE